jgi:hypothetical protein
MKTLTKTASLSTLGLPAGDHLVKFHVDGDSISFEVATSIPEIKSKPKKPTSFVEKWGGSARKIVDESDERLSHINAKHLR